MCQQERETQELKRSQSLASTIHQLGRLILLEAWNGQSLPQLTLIWLAHISAHFVLPSNIINETALHHLSIIILILTAVMLISGYTLLIVLYRHSVQTIFNRNLPRTLFHSLPSFGAHLALLKPLEILFRHFTAPIRVLPDILVLGEVRCGTTSLCQHLSALPGAHPPFCLWKHPELDRKETFYFVGHYLGKVTPSGYNMCFPLTLTRWFHTRIMRRPFFTFDGCAQYLTSPTAPYLIARAYHDAGLPPPILVACVRDPVEQGMSWWRYEHNAMQWGTSMGLTEWNNILRGPLPLTLTDALNIDNDQLYEKAEQLFQSDTKSDCVLPPWAMTWPGGQLAGVGRNGAFWKNIQRYEQVFDNVFGKRPDATALVPASSRLSHVNVVPLEFLKDPARLSLTLSSLLYQVNVRQPSSVTTRSSIVEKALGQGVHRNASIKVPGGMEATHAEEKRLAKLFAKDTAQLEAKCGIQFGWKVYDTE